jgi:hypothetical protein
MMTDEEILSWLDWCPVCGEGLVRIVHPVREMFKYCPKMHGQFRMVGEDLVFRLNPTTE